MRKRTENDAVQCRQCQTPMILVKIRKNVGIWPYIFVGMGIIFTLFFVGAILGIPMIILGLYMLTTTPIVSRCPSCGYYFETITAKYEGKSA